MYGPRNTFSGIIECVKYRKLGLDVSGLERHGEREGLYCFKDGLK